VEQDSKSTGERNAVVKEEGHALLNMEYPFF